jgi:CHC2 zinc finger/Toprim domain
MGIPSDQIERARDVDILEIARGYTKLKRSTSVEWEGPCPVCAGEDRFGVNIRKRTFNCRRCSKGGNVIGLVMHVDDCGFKEAVEKLTGDAWRPSPRSLAPPTPDVDNDNLELAQGIWDGAIPNIIGTPGEDYLAKRGIILDDVPDQGGLRFHPRCPWGHRATAPCIVARYTDAITAEPRGIWRRPLNGEAPKALGPARACVIRLWPDEGKLVLGEGVETTLAAATRIIHHGAYLRPAWAAGSSANMAGFPVLARTVTLILLVDHDQNGVGENAANACAWRWLAAGREVIRLLPDTIGADFNDLVRP